METITAVAVHADEGSVVLFECEHDGPNILVGVDHRMAQVIADDLPCEIAVEPWQVVGFA